MAPPFTGKSLIVTNEGDDHDAMVYVLEGSLLMQVKGGKQVTLTPGQSFYEGPDDVHVVDRNASRAKPVKFLVS